MSENQTPEPIDIYAVVMTMVDSLSAVAWAKLGLQPDMSTGKIEKDLEQAKVAIDIVAHLSSVIEPHLDEADKRSMSGLVRDLRMNYVNKVNEN